MDYKYKIIITIIACVVYSKISNKLWDNYVANNSVISDALDTIGSGVSKNAFNFESHNDNYIKNKGSIGDKIYHFGHNLLGSKYVSKDSIQDYMKRLKELSPSDIDISKLPPEIQKKLRLNKTSKTYDYSHISDDVLYKVKESKVIDLGNELIHEQAKELGIDCKSDKLEYLLDSKSISSVADKMKLLDELKKKQAIGGTNYRKVKKRMNKSGGGFVDKLESGLGPKNPFKIILYWILMFVLMSFIAVICILVVNGYAEFTQDSTSDKDETVGKKLESIVDYIKDNWYKIFIPFSIYCFVRVIYDLIFYDGVFIPVLGDIAEFIEHIPIVWTIVFSIYIFTTYYSIVSMADIKRCDNDNNSIIKRCFPNFKEECETKPASGWCWFKI